MLFFRNAKPFNTSNSAFGETLDKPNTTTVYGALRSKILLENSDLYNDFLKEEGGEITEVIGSPDNKGSLKIRFFSILDPDNNPLLPMPKDLVIDKDDGENIFPLKLAKKPEWVEYDSNYPFNYLLVTDKSIKVEKPKNKFISLMDLEKYLNLDENLHLNNKEENYFTKEYRTGIKIDRKTNRVEEGMIYRKELLNLKEGFKYFLEISDHNDLLPEKGVLKLGGESKAASYEKNEIKNEVKLSDTIKNKIKESKKFKMYLSTSAIFKKGWLPGITNKDYVIRLDNGIEFKIICCSTGKHSMISGWDIDKKQPKPGHRLMPAGSIYYCEVLNENFNVKELIDELHGKSISDYNKKEGFGIVYIGGIK